MRHESPERLAEFLLVLEKRLSDEQIHHLFPRENPTGIRAALEAAAHYLSGGTVKKERKTTCNASAMGSRNSHTMTLFTDGASRGNPGEAGAGIQILDDRGMEIYGEGYYLGQCTNNMAEYQALVAGLTEAKKIGSAEIIVNLDSELIVKQINGQYKVKDAKLKPFFEQAMNLLKSFGSFTVRHIPRAQNRRADQLANEGIDSKRKRVF